MNLDTALGTNGDSATQGDQWRVRFAPLAQEVTASLPALRKYTEAMRRNYASERKAASPLALAEPASDTTASNPARPPLQRNVDRGRPTM